MAGTAITTARRPSSALALPRRRPPTSRDRRSKGAAVARDFAKISPPVKLLVKTVAGGGTELQRATKGLREGELSARSTRFDLPLWLKDVAVELAGDDDLDADADEEDGAAAAADADEVAHGDDGEDEDVRVEGDEDEGAEDKDEVGDSEGDEEEAADEVAAPADICLISSHPHF